MTAVAVTIAGSDPSGGAGIEADLKTFSALGVYGATAITALTAQNTKGVFGIHDVPADFVEAELNAVIIATSGKKLLRGDALGRLRELIARARVVTPNLPEAAVLLDTSPASDEDEMRAQAQQLLALGAGAVFIKGGHGSGPESVDFLLDAGEMLRLAAPRIATKNTHGSGCTLSSAIAAGLAKGLPLQAAAREAKTYVSAAIAAADRLGVGSGPGPLHHFHARW
jgi:hydroxymethylpyrimidine/phosphomethylpyrimidine kinase